MLKTIKPTNLQGQISPPPSKAITHRALLLAALAKSGTTLNNVLDSEDTNATRDGVERMGAIFEELDEGRLQANMPIDHNPTIINCQNSGTSLRLLTGIASLYDREVTLMGDDSLNERPMGPLIDALEQLGATIESENGTPPIVIKEPIRNFKQEVEIDASISSQFISSLLILASVRDKGIETLIKLQPPVVSSPYLKLTEQMLKIAGAKIKKEELTYTVEGKRGLDPFNLTIPADYSSAAFFIVAGALPGNKITIHNLDNTLSQADEKIIEFVKQAGASFREENSSVTVEHQQLEPFEFNLEDCPDLFPCLTVLAACTEGTSKLYGASHLKYKETDRIAAMTNVLRSCSIDVEPTDDGAIIKGGKPKGGTTVDSYHDHRIEMSAAILGTQTDKGLKISNPGSVSISYPNFYDDLNKLSQ